MVSMAVALPLAFDVAIEIFSHILREVVSILDLELIRIITGLYKLSKKRTVNTGI